MNRNSAIIVDEETLAVDALPNFESMEPDKITITDITPVKILLFD